MVISMLYLLESYPELLKTAQPTQLTGVTLKCRSPTSNRYKSLWSPWSAERTSCHANIGG